MSTLAISPKPTLFASLKLLVVRHPFIAYFTIAYAGTWLLNLPLLLGRDGFGLLPYSVPFVLYAILFLLPTYAGPTLGAIVVTAALEGKAGVRQFLRRYGQWRVGLRWYLLLFLGFPLFTFAWISLLIGPAPLVRGFMAHWSTWFTLYLPMLVIFPAIINWGEEPGWRGFAQTRMQAEYGALRAWLVVGLLHGLWHLPAYLLISGPAAMGPFDPWWFALNTLDIMLLAAIFTWVFNNAQGSILLASLAHIAWSAADGWVGSLIPDNVAKQIDIWQGRYIQAACILAFALVILIATKGRLGYQPVDQTQPNARV